MESVRQLLTYLMPAYNFTAMDVPEDDQRGLKEHAQDILTPHGKVVPYHSDNEEAVDPYEIDMKSEDSLSGGNTPLKSRIKKTFMDKWEILAEDKHSKKTKPP